jgi:hypothetical protein
MSDINLESMGLKCSSDRPGHYTCIWSDGTNGQGAIITELGCNYYDYYNENICIHHCNWLESKLPNSSVYGYASHPIGYCNADKIYKAIKEFNLQ